MIDYSVAACINPQKREEDPAYYGRAQVTKKVSLGEFARHISEHNSKYNRADIAAVLTQAVDCLREMLLNGYKVYMGDLGAFQVRLSSRGAVTAKDYNPEIHVRRINVCWTPGDDFMNLKEKAEWNLVANRRVQKIMLKAVKNGDTTVDISKPDEEGAGDEVGAED